MKKFALSFYVHIIFPIIVFGSLFGILVSVAALFEKLGI